MADNNVDTRVVEMQFENKEFERHISTSQESLERFKKELDFGETTKGIDKFAKAFDNTSSLNKFADNVQKLTDKFTGLGNVGEFVVSKLRSKWEDLANTAMGFVNSLTTAQQEAGFVKYESLNKSVQTLRSATGRDEKEIYSILERLNKYTDETSYDFAQGVTSISQLVSSGAATMEQAETTVEGFYNYAAKAGADVNKASTALQYSMVQAFQRGHLDWSNAKELSSRSMLTQDFKDTMLETAVAIGTVIEQSGKYYAATENGTADLKKEINTTNLFNDSLKYQWATSAVLNATLAKYADTTTEFGQQAFAAAQRCTTFSDALNAWKDMLSTGWMQSYRTIFGDLTDAMQLFSGICNKVSDALSVLSTSRNQVLSAWKNTGGKDSLWSMLVGEFESPDEGVKFEGAFGMLDAVIGLGKTISKSFWDTFYKSVTQDEKDAVEELAAHGREMHAADLWDEDYQNELYFGARLTRYTKNIQDFVSSIKTYFTTVDNNSGKTRLEKIQEIFTAIFTTIRTIGAVVSGIFGLFGDIAAQLSPSFDAILDFLSELGVTVRTAEEDMLDSGKITDFFTNLADAIRPLTSLINDVVTDVLGFLTSIITGAKDAEKASGSLEDTTDHWQGVRDFFSGLAEIIRTVLDPIKKGVTDIFDALFKGAKTGSKGAKKGEDSINFLQILHDILMKVAEAIGWVIQQVSDLIVKFINWGRESGVFAAIWETVQKIFTTIWETLKKLAPPFEKFLIKLGDMFKNLFEGGLNKANLKSVWKQIKDAVSELVGDLYGLLPDIGSDVKGFFDKFFGLFRKEKDESIAESAKKAFKFDPSMIIAMGAVSDVGGLRKAGNALEKEGTKVAEVGDGFFGWLSGFWENIKGLFADFKKLLGTDNDLEALLIGVGGFLAIHGVYKLIRNAVKSVTTLGKGITDFSKAISGNLEVKTETRGEKLLKYAAAVALIAGAMYAIAQLPWQGALQGFVAVGLIMVGLVFFIKAMAKAMSGLEWKGMGSMALMIVAVGIGMKKIIDAMQPFFELDEGEKGWDKFRKVCWGLIDILLTLGIFLYAVSGLKVNWKSLSGIIAVAIAINLITGSLMALAEMRMDVGLAQSMDEAFITLMHIMGMTALVGAASRGGGIKDVGLFMIGMAALIVSMQTLTQLVGDPKWLDKLGIMLGTLAAVMILFLGFSVLMTYKGGSLSGTGMKEAMWMALSIAVLIQVLLPLTKFADDPKGWEKLGMMGAALGGILVALGVFSRLMGKNTFKSKGLGNVIALALGIASLILVLKLVADMKWEQLGKMGASFGVVIAGLLVLVGGIRLIEKKLGGGMKKSFSFGTMISLVLGIAALLYVLKPVSEMNKDKLIKMGAMFLVLIGGLALATGLIQKTAPGFKKSIGSMLMIIAFVHSMSRLLNTIAPIAYMDSTAFLHAVALITTVVGELALAIIFIQKTSSGLSNSFGSLITIAAFVAGTIVIINKLKEISGDGNSELIYPLAIFFTELARAIRKSVAKIQSTAGGIDASIGSLVTIAAFAWAAMELINSLSALKGMSIGDVIKSVIVTVVMLSSLSGGVKKMAKNSDGLDIDKAASMLIALVGLAGALIAFGFALSLVKDVKLSTIIVFTLALKSIFKSFSKIIPYSDFQTSALKNAWALLISMAALAGAMAVFGASLTMVKDISIGKILAFSLGLMILLKSFSKIAPYTDERTKTSAIKSSISTLISMAGLAGAMAVFGASLTMVKDISSGKILAFAGGLSALLFVMAKVVPSLGQMSGLGAFKGISIMVLGLAALMGVLALMSGVVLNSIASSLPGFSEALAGLGEALGSFASATKGIGSADMSNAFKILTEVGKLKLMLTGEQISLAVFEKITGKDIQAGNLQAFAADVAAIAPFLKTVGETLQDVSFDNFETAATGLEKMADVQAKLTGKNLLLGAFTKLVPSAVMPSEDSLDKFVEQLVVIAPKLASIGDELQGTNFDNFGTAADALQKLAMLQAGMQIKDLALDWIANLSGVTVDKTALGDFVDSVVEIGPELKRLGDDLYGTDFSNFQTAADAIKALVAVQDALGNSAIKVAFAEWITGSDIDPTGLDKFVSMVTSAAPDLETLGGTLKGKDFSGITDAAEAIRGMVAVQSALNNETLKIAFTDFFTEDVEINTTNISSFVDQIVEAEPKLTELAGALKGKDFSGIGAAADALKGMAEVQNVLNDSNVRTALASGSWDLLGIIKFDGADVETTTLEEFGKQLIPLGQAIAKFADSVTYVEMADGQVHSIDTPGMETAVEAISVLAKLQDSLPTVGGLLTIFNGKETELKDFAKDLGVLGTGIRNIYEEIFKMEDGKAPEVSTIENLSLMIYGIADLIGRFQWQGSFDALIEGLGVAKTELAPALEEFLALGEGQNAERVANISEFLNGLGNAIGALQAPFSVDNYVSALSAIGTDQKFTTNVKSFGKDVVSQIAGAFSGEETQIQTAINALLNSASSIEKYTEKLTLYQYIGHAIASGIASNVVASVGTLTTGIQSTLDTAALLTNYDFSQFETIGTYIAAGVAQGISRGQPLVKLATQGMANSIPGVFRSALAIHSPSKVMATFGKYVTQGVARGITDNLFEVVYAGNALADATVNPMETIEGVVSKISEKGIAGFIQDVIPDSLDDVGNVIKNLSELSLGEAVTDGISNVVDFVKDPIGTLFGRDKTSSDASATTPTTTKQIASQVSNSGSKGSVSSSTMNDLASRIDALGDRIANMQVMLDGKALVGQISEDIDQSIGRLAVKYRRSGG